MLCTFHGITLQQFLDIIRSYIIENNINYIKKNKIKMIKLKTTKVQKRTEK